MFGTIKKALHQANVRKTKCCIVFPSNYTIFFENVVQNEVREKFKISCNIHPYQELTKGIVQDIQKQLQKSCILILGYDGEIKAEQAYKLGIAHAYKSCVILINLEENRNKPLNLPEYRGLSSNGTENRVKG
jgi:hypothetical protein